MSQNDDDGSKVLIFVFVFIGSVALFVAMVVALFVLGALLAATVYLTGLAIITLFRPIEINGVALDAEDGKSLLLRGFLGATLVPLIAIVASMVTSEEIFVARYWYYYVLGGYVFATTILEILFAQDEASNQVEYLPPQPTVHQQTPPALPRPEPQSFRFASWSDEDGR